jgi:hypothetical protein
MIPSMQFSRGIQWIRIGTPERAAHTIPGRNNLRSSRVQALRGIPGVEFKTRAPEQMESVLLPTTCTFTPIGLALEDNLDVMIRRECLAGTKQNAMLPAFDVDLD